jgi:hypothetical protein
MSHDVKCLKQQLDSLENLVKTQVENRKLVLKIH